MIEALEFQGLDRVRSKLFGPGVSSETRAGVMLLESQAASPDEFMRIFVNAWASCDDTWSVRGTILKRLRVVGRSRYFTDDASQQMFDSLPPLVQVFRGCSIERVRGISWSLDRDVARSFARGHLGISVPRPVIAQAMISKEFVFAVFAEREESEVVIDPRRYAD